MIEFLDASVAEASSEDRSSVLRAQARNPANIEEDLERRAAGTTDIHSGTMIGGRSRLTFVDGERKVHFDRESCIQLGQRYCDALLKVTEKD